MNPDHPVVLLVDDDPVALAAWAGIMRRRQIPAVAVGDAASAIEMFERHPIRVLLTDLEMPGMDGVDVFMELRARSPLLRGIVCSGYLDSVNLLRVAESGFHRIIAKPISLAAHLAAEVLGQLAEAEHLRALLLDLRRKVPREEAA